MGFLQDGLNGFTYALFCRTKLQKVHRTCVKIQLQSNLNCRFVCFVVNKYRAHGRVASHSNAELDINWSDGGVADLARLQ